MLHTRDTEANEARVVLVLTQYSLTRNTDIHRENTSVVRIRVSVGVSWGHRDHSLLFCEPYTYH